MSGRPTVIVTGACGFIGRHVTKTFAAEGTRVVGIGHGSWSADEWSRWGLARWQAADVSHEALHKLGERPTTVVHCAGGSSVSASIESEAEDEKRTVGTTKSVLDFVVRDAPDSKVVLLSSAAVYGEVAHLPIKEDASLAPISPYGRHKLTMENLCRSYCDQHGVSAAILRFFSIYGPGLRKQLFWDACQKLQAKSCVFQGTGDERRDWLHVSDAVGLIKLVATKASHGCITINGGSGRSVTVRSAVEAIARLLESPMPQFRGERREGDPVGYEADIGRARSLCWEPKQGFAKGIADYVAWYRGAQA
ncbi:MAG TPA: NAD(P)-dependent oxidoreductase [Candidatus Acidoferrales bacterium]|nr:NAD(P)-dependent oxidoreductase [Candidatus Acidoferrales bacterium]